LTPREPYQIGYPLINKEKQRFFEHNLNTLATFSKPFRSRKKVEKFLKKFEKKY